MAVLGATSLTGCNSIPQFIAGTADVGASASRTVFRMATSPVSWTKDTTAFDGTLRVVNGASLSPGGSSNFPTVFAASVPLSVTLNQSAISLTVSPASAFPGAAIQTQPGGNINTDNATLSVSQTSSHEHPYIYSASGAIAPGATANVAAQVASSPSPTGGYGASPAAHNHVIAAHTHPLLSGETGPHNHQMTGQHSHTVTTTQNFNINYVDMIISIKD